MSPDFEDHWHTPKHIKIEREGEPRDSRRGATKKKDRRKGPKARMDEIISMRNQARLYLKWIKDDDDKNWGRPIREAYRRWYARDVKKLDKMLKTALEDGIITEKGVQHCKEGLCVL